MKCPKCEFETTEASCPRCGVVFGKLGRVRPSRPEPPRPAVRPQANPEPPEISFGSSLFNIVFLGMPDVCWGLLRVEAVAAATT